MYIFDLDGTLTDSNGLWLEVDMEFLSRRGLAPTAEYEDAVARSIFPAAAAFTKEYYRLPDEPEAIMAEWEALAARHYRELVPLKPGAEAFLRQCRERGVPMALFTACRPALCAAALERHGLGPYFGHVVYAEELGLEKHDPRCFARLCGLIGARPEDCTLFDDSPSNCAAARAAGMRAVGVCDRFYAGRREELRAASSRCVRSLEELLDRPTGRGGPHSTPEDGGEEFSCTM